MIIVTSECKREKQQCWQRKERTNQHTKAKKRNCCCSYCADSFQARASGVSRGSPILSSFLLTPPSFPLWSDPHRHPYCSPSTLPTPTFTWASHFPRGIKLTGPVWFRQVGCQCSLQAHGEPWIMDLPRVWVPLGLPAAPSPHSCCDWNSQCPINNQWFIKVLTASAQETGNVEERLLMGGR